MPPAHLWQVCGDTSLAFMGPVPQPGLGLCPCGGWERIGRCWTELGPSANELLLDLLEGRKNMELNPQCKLHEETRVAGVVPRDEEHGATRG